MSTALFSAIARTILESWAPASEDLVPWIATQLEGRLGWRLLAIRALTAGQPALEEVRDGYGSLLDIDDDWFNSDDSAAALLRNIALSTAFANRLRRAFEVQWPRDTPIADSDILFREFVEIALYDQLSTRNPVFLAMLLGLGIADDRFNVDAVRTGDILLREACVSQRVHLDRFVEFLTATDRTLLRQYWPLHQTPRGLVDRLFLRLALLMNSLGIDAVYSEANTSLSLSLPQASAAAIAIELAYDESTTNPGIRVSALGEYRHTQSLGVLTLHAQSSLRGGVLLTRSAILPVGDGQFEATFFWPPVASTNSRILFGTEDTTRLEIRQARCGIALSTSPPRATVGMLFNCAVTVAVHSQTAFVRALLPQSGIRSSAEISVALDSNLSLLVNGSSSLQIRLASALSLGPIRLNSLSLSLTFQRELIQLGLSVEVEASLGPLRFRSGGIGTAAQFVLDADNPGAVALRGTVLPPQEIAVDVRAPIVSGSGAVLIDHQRRHYSGTLSLQVASLAVATWFILESSSNTSNWSLAGVISARFPGVPLGMGFFLSGVGGLIGIHRTLNLSLLSNSLSDSSNADVVFPETTNASESVVRSALELLPSAHGRYTFGPAAQLTYGPPSTALATISIALLVDVPQPVSFALLGRGDIVLPRSRGSIVELHVQILGTVDSSQQLVSIDAALNNSRIGPLSLYGDFAFRLGWGEQPYFLLSIGGFNPHFQAPSNFPTLRRLTLGYTAPGGLVRLRIESYFAITSNTLQLGARIEVQVRVEIASIDGMLAFDALVIFSPFSFRIDFLASLSVTVFGAKLLAIHLEGTIKGPKPWHVTGKARLSVLFIEAAVDVDVKFGGEPSLEELPAVDPTDRLLEALRAPASWKGELMPGVSRPVSLSDASSSETPLFDPVGVPAVRQTIVPLNRKLDRFAEGRIGGPGRYDVRAARVGTAPATQRPAHELFAAAQFEQMSDAEKLSRPSFEKMDAGALLASDAISVGPKSQGAGLFEQIKLGDDETPTTATLPREQILASSRSGASSLRGLRVQGSDRFAPPVGSAPRVALADELYVAVRRDSLQPAERSVPETAGAASALVQWLAEESGGASLFQVAPAFEVTGGESR